MSKKYIIVEADTNDGDYVTKKTLISDKNISEVREICKVICEDGDWGTGDIKDEDNDPKRWVKAGLLTTGQINLFSGFIPSSEYGVHSIESVEIIEVVNNEVLM